MIALRARTTISECFTAIKMPSKNVNEVEESVLRNVTNPDTLFGLAT